MPKPVSRETIAVDIDDVVANHAEAFVEFANQKYGANLTLDEYHNNWSELLGIDRDEVKRLGRAFHLGENVLGFAVKEGASEALTQLKETHDLVVVTARMYDLAPSTQNWIDRHYQGLFSEVRFVPVWTEEKSVTKAEMCKELGATYLIDDDVGHCNLAAGAGVGAVLFGDYGWNRNKTVAEGVTRVKDWPAVLEYFDGRS